MRSALAVLVIMMAAGSIARAGQPSIVTSIHPLALIVKEIAGEQAAVTVLVPPNVSPHHYSMKPSERVRLEEAHLFVWLGPAMEPFLSNTMDAAGLERKSIALHRRSPESAGSHGEHRHGQVPATQAGDPHLWLDPDWVRSIVPRLADSLTAVPGLEHRHLEQNQEAFLQRLRDKEKAIRQRLEALPPLELFTYHGAFHHFAEHFDLSIAGMLTPHPQQNPGARHLTELREKISTAVNPCIMTEPQFSGDWRQGLNMDQPVKVSHWDPLGTDIEPGMGSYTSFLDELGNAVIRCAP